MELKPDNRDHEKLLTDAVIEDLRRTGHNEFEDLGWE